MTARNLSKHSKIECAPLSQRKIEQDPAKIPLSSNQRKKAINRFLSNNENLARRFVENFRGNSA